MPRLALLTLASLSLLGGCSRTPASPDALVGVSEPEAAHDLDTLGRQATLALALTLAETDPTRLAIVEGLRASGPASVDELIADYQRAAPSSAEQHAAWRGLIDQVAQQRDAHYGGLFWYRDMNQARAAAAASGKPILSLRLLGELTSEYSCANSRLFRTLLYADPELAAWLEHEFVLHWSSERPVPRLDIDFGDGRRIARTITGNSAHFVLDARGRTLDVVPGLIARDGFRAALTASLELHAELAELDDDAQWRASLAAAHERRFTSIATQMTEQLGRTRATLERDELEVWLGRSQNPSGAPVPALAAVPMAAAKSRIEAPVLAAAPRELGGVAPTPAEIRPSEAELWQLGHAATGEPELHPNSEAIIAAERPLVGLVPAERLAEAELAMRAALLRSLVIDSGKNLYEMRARVAVEIARRARAEDSLGFADVDAWIYADLFETPASDPWLGLVDPTVYTGLDAGGLRAQ
jgi:hypothetical protein